VLLIDFRLLTSYGDLAEFLGLFRRPVQPSAKLYGERIPVAFVPGAFGLSLPIITA